MSQRPDWDDYFLKVSDVVAERATCDRGRAGCVIANNKRILTTGYVGAPAGLPHCDDVGHHMKEVKHGSGDKSKHCVRTTHAEQNAIVQASRSGVSIQGATLYCKMTPCHDCAKMIVNAGIERVVCRKDYHAADDTKEIFDQAGVDLEIRNREVEQYNEQ
ncbi:MAG: cytidine/deoxycytidylate deaminase family protein [Candidatus Nanohaloarchaea archaeon]|nr:cytidine/deoxycytidylate deaminase family protein [Candidatus Nanohaloarchaea archaeon]